jgi:hypothetical protein
MAGMETEWSFAPETAAESRERYADPGPAAQAVAATSQDERRAAVGAVRRQAFGPTQREVV